MLLFSPRMGFRAVASDHFDFLPRAGVTFLRGTAQAADEEECPASPGSEDCGTVAGDKLSASATALSIDLAAAIRVTDSFNVLGGLAFEMLLAADGEVEEHHGDGETQAASFKGSARVAQVWFRPARRVP